MSAKSLPGTWNFRDISEETGIRPGKFYRSSELSQLDDSGQEQLRRLGVTDVADLRSPVEVERRGPGRVPEGVEVHLLPFPDLGATDGQAPHEVTFQKMMAEKPDIDDVSVAAKQYMAQLYEQFPTLRGARRAAKQVVDLLVDERPVIAHCFAGKDRTGFTVATVLAAVGVDRDAIITDFLRSNDAIGRLREQILVSMRNRSAETPEVLTFAEARLTDEVLGVQEDYLVAAWRTIDNEFGSLEGYLKAADVSTEDVAKLRTVLRG